MSEPQHLPCHSHCFCRGWVWNSLMESIQELQGTLPPTLQPAGMVLKGYLLGQVICRSVCLGQGE